MAVLKDLIVHGSSRFLNGIQTDSLKANTIDATNGYFKYLKAIDGDIENLSVQDLLAQKATVVGLLDVKGELHTNTWTNSNIANIGGVFYISPTVISTTATVVIGGSANSRTLTVSDGSFATTTVPTWNGTSESTSGWVIGSRVMVTGSVTYNNVEYPLGTCTGYISGALSASGFTVQQISSKALESIFAVVGTNSLSGSNIQISMYEIGPGNNNNQSNTASYKPVGILMTSYGMADKSTHIDIYGGVNAKNTSSKTSGMADPNVRIGYLGGLDSYTDTAGNTRTPMGWGIYTDNGFFKGVIVADSGSIGHFTINSKAIYSGSHSAWNTSATGIFLGTNDTNYYISGGSGASWWIRDDGRFQFGGTGGITYNGTTLSIPAANVSGALTAATISADKITTGTIATSVLTANKIVTDTLESGTVGTTGYVYLSTKNYGDNNHSPISTTVANHSSNLWKLIVGNKFGVDTNGALYCTYGAIGGFSIDANQLTCYATDSGSATSTTGIYQAKMAAAPSGSGVGQASAFGVLGRSSTSSAWAYRTRITYAGELIGYNFIAVDENYATRAAINTNGLTIYNGSGTLDSNKIAIFGSTATIGYTSGNKYNVYIDGSAINLRYNTTTLNLIDASGMTLQNSSGEVLAELKSYINLGTGYSNTYAGSATIGTGLTSAKANQIVVGKYNQEDDDAMFIVGNGNSDEDRSNLMTVGDNFVRIGNEGDNRIELSSNSIELVADSGLTALQTETSGEEIVTLVNLSTVSKKITQATTISLDLDEIENGKQFQLYFESGQKYDVTWFNKVDNSTATKTRTTYNHSVRLEFTKQTSGTTTVTIVDQPFASQIRLQTQTSPSITTTTVNRSVTVTYNASTSTISVAFSAALPTIPDATSRYQNTGPIVGIRDATCFFYLYQVKGYKSRYIPQTSINGKVYLDLNNTGEVYDAVDKNIVTLLTGLSWKDYCVTT